VRADHNILSSSDQRLRPLDLLQLRAQRQPVLLRELASNISAFNGGDVADMAHYLCLLHGRYPGLMDNLADRMVASEDSFYIELAERFTAERRLLTDLTVAAGPVGRLVGEDQSMTVVEQLRVAIDLLARSDREGCALGAAAALLIEWKHARPALDAIARRLSVKTTDIDLDDYITRMYERIASHPKERQQRAIIFGINQLTHQHEQFWLLLNNRCAARRAAFQS